MTRPGSPAEPIQSTSPRTSHTYRYRQAVLDQLAVHGLRPGLTTPPDRLREQVNDLYRHEIRGLRRDVRAQAFPRHEYSSRVIALRKRYWLLSLTVDRWV